MNRLALAVATLVLAATPGAAQDRIAARLSGAGGQVTVLAAPKGVLVRIEATGLTPGWHAVHFHEKADCSDAAFKAAGAHVHGVTPSVHGLLNPQANDSGDLPNIFVGADGTVKGEMFSALISLKPGASKPALLDADGSALVIHARPDDYTTQPIGGAGDRIACAVLR